MMLIPLAQLPNQEFTVSLDNIQYSFRIKQATNCMVVSLSINQVRIIDNIPIVNSYPIIPYQYLMVGNFTLVTVNDDLPDYTQFNISQFLYYASPSELAALNTSS